MGGRHGFSEIVDVICYIFDRGVSWQNGRNDEFPAFGGGVGFRK